LKEILDIIQFQPPAVSRAAPHQLRLPRAPFNLALSASRDRAPQLPWEACARASPPFTLKETSHTPLEFFLMKN